MKYISNHDLSLSSGNANKINGGIGERKEIKPRKTSHKGSKRNYYLEKDEWEDYYDE